MIDVIGEIAGRIWTYLDINGESTLTNLKKGIGEDVKSDQITMSLGWLAREGKIGLNKKGTSVKVQLIK